jgi:hypothetical protein
MKTQSLLRIALAAVLFASLSGTMSAQSRQRLVKRPDPQAATVTGRVIQAGTTTPIAEAHVQIGGRAALTAADGTFTLSGLAAETYQLEVTHWLYVTQARQVTLSPGQNQIDINLQPAASTSVRMKSGTTAALSSPTVQFGYVVAFVGWRSFSELRICLPSGQESTIQIADMKSVAVVGTRTETTECCSLAPGTVVRITRRSGEVVEGTIRESCSGSDFYVLGRNRATGNFDSLRLLDVESVTFE